MILLSTVGLKTRFLQSFQRARWFSLPSGIKNKIPTDSQLIHWMSAVAITSWLCVKLKHSLHFIFIFHTDRTLWVNDGHLVNFHQICSNSAEKGLALVVSEDRLFFYVCFKSFKRFNLALAYKLSVVHLSVFEDQISSTRFFWTKRFDNCNRKTSSLFGHNTWASESSYAI